MRHDLALVLLIFGLLGQVALLGANLFEAVVDVPNWRTSEGLSAYRRFIAQRNAGHFYRVLSPLTIVCLGTAFGLGWGAHGPRNGLLTVSLAAAITAELFTVAYFFPRNRDLFFADELPSPERARALVGQWSRANALRIIIVLAGASCGLLALYATGAGALPW